VVPGWDKPGAGCVVCVPCLCIVPLSRLVTCEYGYCGRVAPARVESSLVVPLSLVARRSSLVARRSSLGPRPLSAQRLRSQFVLMRPATATVTVTVAVTFPVQGDTCGSGQRVRWSASVPQMWCYPTEPVAAQPSEFYY
jgi:hypothetical protein